MPNPGRTTPIVWWIVWAALQAAVFQFYFVLGHGPAPQSASEPGSRAWLLGLIPTAFSCVVRWALLSRMQSASRAFPVFVMGIALAETTCFLGLFIFPAFKLELFVASAVGIFQFIPYYASRMHRNDDEPPPA